MKHPEYDSPFNLVMSDIETQAAKSIDEMCWKAVQRVGINVDKEKLLVALKQDAERYREAYAKGYETGYENRDDEIVRCKDCCHGEPVKNGAGEDCIQCNNDDLWLDGNLNFPDWYCADGERR